MLWAARMQTALTVPKSLSFPTTLKYFSRILWEDSFNKWYLKSYWNDSITELQEKVQLMSCLIPLITMPFQYRKKQFVASQLGKQEKVVLKKVV